jgi:hypothetical protein
MVNSTPKKILILAANPKNSGQLRLDEEVREIDEGLRRSIYRDGFELSQKWAVRPRDIQRALSDLSPQIVHFSGHGVGTASEDVVDPQSRQFTVVRESLLEPEGLVLEDDAGKVQLVGTDAIASLFELFADRIQCVVLNACYSEKQAAAIAQHIPYVVGMNQAVGDKAAIAFAVGFYDALGAGRDFEFAYQNGCVAIKLAGIPEHLTPVLKRRSTDNLDPQAWGDLNLEEPEGAVKLNSDFYIERPPVEERCYREIEAKGALIKIKAARQMGKSSLMIRLRDRASQLGYKAVNVDFELADRSYFADLDKFLRWFCASVGGELGLPRKFDEYWDDEFFTSKNNCTKYFKSYLLTTISSPIALTLDKVDILFDCPIANEFFGLLRVWHEMAKRESIWENLRLVVAHSQDPERSNLDINRSPFGNVGVPIELVEFNRSQVKDLAARHGLTWSDLELQELMEMVGGHPYLVRVALYQTARQYISFQQLLAKAPTEAGVYGNHLRRHLKQLTSNNLVAAMQQVVTSDNPVRLSPAETSLLEDMGLISLQGNDAIASCNLYRLYFGDRLRGL